MRFQQRDGEILSMIYVYDGVLALRHLKMRFWPNATLRAAQKRLSKLLSGNYLARPTVSQRRTQPIPEPIYWLGWKGILWIAGQHGASIAPPTSHGESQMRRLAKRLRDHGIHWLREPRWLQLAHDLAVVDFRRTIEASIQDVPTWALETWTHETVFRSEGDVISYQVKGTDGRLRTKSKFVYPDSYFVITDRQRHAQGQLARARFLLEVDRATHSNIRFGKEKVAPGVAYIQSRAYKRRFGNNSGRWLIVTTGERRMQNLMRQTHEVAGTGASVFFFTFFEALRNANVLTQPIWRQVGEKHPVSLLPAD